MRKILRKSFTKGINLGTLHKWSTKYNKVNWFADRLPSGLQFGNLILARLLHKKPPGIQNAFR